MDRKWESGAGVAPPPLTNASDGYASPGNAGTGVQPTQPGAHWFHMITEELLSVIAFVGTALDKTVVTQLRDALILLFDPQGIEPGGRLTLTTGVPVTNTDVAGAATVYYTPHRHNRIRLFDGTRWKWYTFAELSQALNDATKSPAATIANKNYDMFVWDDGGVTRCTRGPKWDDGAVAGSDTARGTGANSTELEFYDGRWVNKIAITNGPAARRGLYVGTVRTDGTPAANDTLAKRHVWNTYNRRARAMQVQESADSWTYTTNAIRQANGNTANQLDFVIGLSEDEVTAHLVAVYTNTVAAAAAQSGIGLDATNARATKCCTFAATTAAANIQLPHFATFADVLPIGRHILVWTENGMGAAGGVFGGDLGDVRQQGGLTGRMFG